MIRVAQGEARIKALRVFATKATEFAFRDLEDFVAGRITHVLLDCEYGSCTIASIDSELNELDYNFRRIEGLKLLSLLGRSDGTLQWRIHSYGDGSGGSKQIIPCRGLEEAKRLAQELFDNRCQNWRDGTIKAPPLPSNYKGFTVLVPEDVVEYWSAKAAEDKAQRIANLEEELRKAREE